MPNPALQRTRRTRPPAELRRWASKQCDVGFFLHVRIAVNLLDHLVGAEQYCLRDGDAECFGGLHVDHQLEFGRLADG